MKKLLKILLILTVFLAGSRGIFAQTGINPRVNFQGKVVNKGVGATDGTNVIDGSYDFKFSLWNVLSAGASIWSETWNSGTTQVAVNSGIFAVALGTYTSLSPTVDFNNPNIYLSVEYNHDGEMSPRIQMTAVPFAFNAEKVNGLTVTNTTGTLTIPNGSSITFGSSFTTTGVGITLDQSLATTDSPTFAGLSVGASVTFTNIPVAIGTTVLFIDATGKLTRGYMTQGVGTTYIFNNGLNDPGTHIVGLGGSLAANTQIGTSGFGLTFLGLNGTQSLFIGSSGFVGIGNTNPKEYLDVFGNIRVGNSTTGTIRSAQELVFREDGDTYGSSILRLRNRNAENGAIFETTDPTAQLVDFIFKTSAAQRNIRFESRSQARTGLNSFEIGGINPDNPTLSVGDNYAAIANNLTIGTYTSASQVLYVSGDANITTNLTVGGALTLTGISSGVGSTVLYINSAGNLVQGTLPTGGSTYTATNGINLNGLSFGLGGTLTANTNIGVSSFGLSFTNSTPILYLSSDGNVGIGTTSPKYLLDINGWGNFSSGLGIGGTSNLFILDVNGSGAVTDIFSSNLFTSKVGIGTSDPGVYSLNVGGTAIFSGLIVSGPIGMGISTPSSLYNLTVGNSAAFSDMMIGGQVGLGTSTPGLFKLNIAGSMVSTDYFATNIFSTKVGIGTSTTGVYSLLAGGTVAVTDFIIGGQVGIGNSTPGLYKLSVGNTAAFSGLIIGGVVGLGTSTPNSLFKLNIAGSMVSNDYFATNIFSTKVGIGTSTPGVYSLLVGGTLGASDVIIGGKVGLGTSTPGLFKLNIAGSMVSNDYFATNIFSTKVGIGTSTPGVYSLSVGNTAAFSGLIIGGVVGLGTSTPNSLFKLNIAGSMVSNDYFATNIFSTKVGIGTSTPGVYSLNVGGTANFNNLFTSGNVSIGGSLSLTSIPIGAGTTILYISSTGILTQGTLPPASNYTATNGLNLNNFAFGLGGSLTDNTQIGVSSFGLSFVNGGSILYMSNGGLVGIGTTNPGAKLEVNSGTSDTAGLKFSQVNSGSSLGTGNGRVLTVDGSGNVFLAADQVGGAGTSGVQTGTAEGQTVRFGLGTSQWVVSNFLYNNDSRIGMGTTAPSATLDVNAGVGDSNILNLSYNGTSKFTVTNNGTVKVGTLNVNSVGETNLMDLSYNGISRVTVANSGSIQVKGTSADDVKTTSGTGTASDFEGTGTTFINVTSSNNQISIDAGTFPDNPTNNGVFSTTGISTTWPVGVGSQVILRDDGDFLILGGGATSATGIGAGSSAASLWDGVGTTMSLIRVAIGNTGPGAGSVALKRPDGRYLLVHGNNSGYTSVFDPYGRATVVAGPSFGGVVTTPAGAGTNAFQRWDGRYIVLGGGTTAWAMYDPSIGTTGTFISGLGVTYPGFGPGSHAIMRDDGNFLVFQGNQGVGSTNYWFYSGVGDSSAGRMNFNAGTMPAPQLTANAFSVRMNNGKFLILDGGTTNTSWVYDQNAANYGSLTQYVGTGMGPGDTLSDGAITVWRQDGKYLLFVGAGSTDTWIIDPSQDAGASFVSIGPSLPAVPGVGMVPFMGSDGKYYYARGNINGANAVDSYNIGFVIGGGGTMVGGAGSTVAYYESEPINTNGDLNLDSSLSWNANSEGSLQFFARVGTGAAGVAAASYKPILRSGDSLGVGDSGNDYVQIRIAMTKDLPKFLDQEWGVRKANQTRYRRVNRDPVVYDYTVDNSASVHRTQFDFGNSTDDSGPVAVNLINDRDRNLGLSLAISQNAGGLNMTSSSLYNGVFGYSNGLPFGVGVSQATIVMRKANGNYTVAIGQTSSFAFDYNAVSQTFSVGTTLPYKLGAGALAFKRPDGKYFIVIGDGTSYTALYDPVLDTYSTATPLLTGMAGRGAMALPLPNGRVLIFHGNFLATSSIYDPFSNTIVEGVQTSRGVGNGSLFIPRPDGSFLLALGTPYGEGCTTAVNQNTTNTFNPYTMTVGPTSPAISLTALKSIGPGSMAIPRADGNWVVVLGAGQSSGTGVAGGCVAQNNTMLYNPIMNKIIVGPNTTANVGYGAFVVPRADGNWLVMHGGGAATTSIYLEGAGVATADIGLGGTFVGGPVSTGVIGGLGASQQGTSAGGGLAFQRDDGKYVVILGAGGSGLNQLDALWVDKGTYRSEQMYVPNLDGNSTLTWRAVPYAGISAEVKTASSQNGLQDAVAREIATPGQMVNPGTNEKWISVAFNFRRTFPSYDSINRDVWFNSGTQNGVNRRIIITPTLNEFSITKDVNLIDLKSDGVSVFRVSSNGNVYTANNGVVNSGGADLAENYTSTQELQKGEVVSIDPANNHAVQRSKYQYQPDLVGVVSSDPGFVAGAYTVNSFPIALVGRVPVKVSNENGMIRTGDRLTSSSIPGYAMKASKAGRVIGKVLESIDPAALTDCPISDFGNTGKKCTTVMTFVNLSDYLGMPVEMAMADSNREIGANIGSSVPGWMNGGDEQILQYLADSKDQVNASAQSDIFTDRLVSTKIVADTIVANKIKANSIEGLEVFTNQIGSLNDKYNQLANQVANNASSSAVVSITPTNPLSQIFNFNGQTQFSGNLLVKAFTEFWNNVLFKGEVGFEKTPVFNKEMAGFAVIDAGQTGVEVKFDQEYSQTPVVNVTMVVEDGKEQPVLDQNYVYFVTKKSTGGFSIRLNKPAVDKVQFSWSALAIKDAKTYENKIMTITPIPSGLMPSITDVPTITVEPTEVVPTATITPEPTDSAVIN